MRKLATHCLLFLLCFTAQPIAAQVLVLVHGYHASASTWLSSGVISILAENGWRTVRGPQQGNQSNKTLYNIELPARAPLTIQADILKNWLHNIRQQHLSEKLTLVGHSAGGVVSRLALLGQNPAKVDALITIAAPHLGTPGAAQGLDIVNSKPFFCPGPGIDLIKSFFGGNDYRYLKHSQGTLYDLLPPASGNVLAWANSQSHPDIQYHAIIRYSPGYIADEIVPAYSQDMNQIPALAGKVTVWPTATSHSLNPGDGYMLVTILGSL